MYFSCFRETFGGSYAFWSWIKIPVRFILEKLQVCPCSSKHKFRVFLDMFTLFVTTRVLEVRDITGTQTRWRTEAMTLELRFRLIEPKYVPILSALASSTIHVARSLHFSGHLTHYTGKSWNPAFRGDDNCAKGLSSIKQLGSSSWWLQSPNSLIVSNISVEMNLRKSAVSLSFSDYQTWDLMEKPFNQSHVNVSCSTVLDRPCVGWRLQMPRIAVGALPAGAVCVGVRDAWSSDETTDTEESVLRDRVGREFRRCVRIDHQWE
jgi:hypothetical protein